MVRGLFSHLQFAYAYFPCHNITGDLLYDPFWEAVYRLERSGFKLSSRSRFSMWFHYLYICMTNFTCTTYTQVMDATFDGASINQRLVRLHNQEKKLLYKVPNPFATDDRNFFFFSDPPHLIKTTRNCWALKCRTLWVCVLNCIFV